MIMIRAREPDDSRAEHRFRPGELVVHRRYGYRGVVVALDASCQADELWYQSNKTQPQREQAWYHVLVDGGVHTTYAAEENLEADRSGEPIRHPLIEYFFLRFEDGRYVRNQRPWPA